MAVWKVTVYREWKEFGELEVVADSDEEAREDAQMALDDDAIRWRTDTLRPKGRGLKASRGWINTPT